jgi:hypothetical protein
VTDDQLVAGNCWAFDEGDCAGPVEWRTYPPMPRTSYAMCDSHWRQYGPDGPAAVANAVAAVARITFLEPPRRLLSLPSLLPR